MGLMTRTALAFAVLSIGSPAYSQSIILTIPENTKVDLRVEAAAGREFTQKVDFTTFGIVAGKKGVIICHNEGLINPGGSVNFSCMPYAKKKL